MVPCQNKIILKNLRPVVDRPKIIFPKIILLQHGTTSKIILKNFSINVHEAVLQPIAAFMYCNHHAAAAAVVNVGNFCVPRCHQAPAQLTPPMGGVLLKLFYDGTTREIK